MNAVPISSKGGPDVLQLKDVPALKVGKSQILVKNRYACVNLIDT